MFNNKKIKKLEDRCEKLEKEVRGLKNEQFTIREICNVVSKELGYVESGIIAEGEWVHNTKLLKWEKLLNYLNISYQTKEGFQKSKQ